MPFDIFLDKPGVDDGLGPLQTEISELEGLDFETTDALGPNLKSETNSLHGTVQRGIGAAGSFLTAIVGAIRSATNETQATDEAVGERTGECRIPR